MRAGNGNDWLEVGFDEFLIKWSDVCAIKIIGIKEGYTL